ncbi:MAG: hypothetical protein LBG16_02075, partial [Elusimicrobiota bacterium]|nr:hypothetical protein [Elusimicrobiota bacterium]
MKKSSRLRGILKNNAVRVVLALLAVVLITPFFFADYPKKRKPAGREIVLSDEPLVWPGLIRTASSAAGNVAYKFARTYGLKDAPVITEEEKLNFVKPDPNVDYDKLLSEEAARVRALAALEEKIEKQRPAPAAADNAREYVTLDGKGPYEIIKDSKGRKVVMLPEGPVFYEKFARDNVSSDEINELRKLAPKLKEWQLIEAIQYARNNNYPGGAAQFLQSGEYAKLSKNGTKSLFGGSASVSGRRGKGGSKGAFGLGGGIDGTAENDTNVGGISRVYTGRHAASGAVAEKLRSVANNAKKAAAN